MGALVAPNFATLSVVNLFHLSHSSMRVMVSHCVSKRTSIKLNMTVGKIIGQYKYNVKLIFVYIEIDL